MGFDVPMERTPDNVRVNNVFQYTATDSAMFPLLDIGDIAFVEKTINCKSGQTILFTLDNKDYIRKIIKDKDFVELQAMNAYYPIIRLSKEEIIKRNFKIIGRVIKVENTSAFK